MSGLNGLLIVGICAVQISGLPPQSRQVNESDGVTRLSGHPVQSFGAFEFALVLPHRRKEGKSVMDTSSGSLLGHCLGAYFVTGFFAMTRQVSEGGGDASPCGGAGHLLCAFRVSGLLPYQRQVGEGAGPARPHRLQIQSFGLVQVAVQLANPSQVDQGIGEAGFGGLQGELLGLLRIPVHLSQSSQAGQGFEMARLDDLAVELFCALEITSLLTFLSQSHEDTWVSISSWLDDGLHAVPVSLLLSHPRQVDQQVYVACFGRTPGQLLCGRAVPRLFPGLHERMHASGIACLRSTDLEVMPPLKSMPCRGRSCEVAEILRLREVRVSGVPEGGGWTYLPTCTAPMLFQIVSESIHRAGCRYVGGIRISAAGWVALGTGAGTTERCLFAVDRASEFGKCGLDPVLAQLVIVMIGEVVDRCVGEERLRKVKAHSEAARVHSCLQYCLGWRRAEFVAAKQFRSPGQVLRYPSIASGPGEGVRQRLIAAPCQSSCLAQRFLVEGVRNSNCASSQQLPHSAVWIGRVCVGAVRVRGGVLRPQCAQDQNGTTRVSEEVVDCGSDPLPHQRVAEVVLSLVQPHHCVRLYPFKICKGGLSSRGIEGVP